ncbi:MAG: ATPase, T2SS/T4P/T4SS family [Candidatus Ozemobacteraceae bacterium]
MKRKRIGEALVEMGVVTQEQINLALKKQKELGVRLGKVLVELKMCTEDHIVTVLSQQLEIKIIQLEKIDIPEEILKSIPETIIRSHILLPVSKLQNVLTVVMADPLDMFIIDEIQYQTNLTVEPAIASESLIQATIKRFFESVNFSETLATMETDSQKNIVSPGQGGQTAFDLNLWNDAAVVKFASNVIKQAIDQRASDIHVEPEEDGMRIRLRIDGVLAELVRVPKASADEIISRFKIMADMDISEKRLPQDGRIRVIVNDRIVDIRASSLPCIGGEKIGLRLLDKMALKLTLSDIGFEEDMKNRFALAVKQPNGIILLNGPTGSGKTSTLYAALNYIVSPKINISTAEDPVEMAVEGINQVQVKADIGLTFARTLRALMRQDPNVILIGEIRDEESAQIAVESALTGHLVLSTLHTNDAPATVERLIKLGVEHSMIASTLIVAVAQRLVRRICKNCIQPFEPSMNLLEELNFSRFKFDQEPKFFQGKGCFNCNATGYKGRTAIHEMLFMNDRLKRMIIAKVTTTELRNAAIECGMFPLRATAIRKAFTGLTSIDEILRVTKSEKI